MPEEAIKTQPKLNYAKLSIIAMAYIAIGLCTQGFLAILTLVRNEFAISSAQAGLYTTFFFLSSTSIAIFSGRLVDKLGSKRGLVLGTLAVGTLMILNSQVPAFAVLLVLAFFSGLGFSLITPSVNKAVTGLAPPGRRAMSLGITHAGNALGAVLGASMLPYLGTLLGWRTAILISGSIAILISILLQIFYKQPSSGEKSIDKPQSRFKEDLKEIILNKALRCVALVGFMFGFSISSVTTHLVIFLDQDIGFTPGLAGIALAVLQVGGVIGQPGWGYINDGILGGNRRLGFLLIGMLAGLFILLIGTLVPSGIVSGILVFGLVFLLGISSLGLPGLYFTTVGDIIPERLLGTATGLALVFVRAGVIAGPPLFGLVADLSGSYTASWLILGFLMLGVTALFYLISAHHIKECNSTAA